MRKSTNGVLMSSIHFSGVSMNHAFDGGVFINGVFMSRRASVWELHKSSLWPDKLIA